MESSMRLLKRQRLDLYMIHEPEQFEITDELNDFFQSLQRDGAISAFGLAYGSVPPEVPSLFGSVEQCQYAAKLTPRLTHTRIRLFHGVLRHGLQDEDSMANRLSAGKLISKVLNENVGCGVIFSASSRHQIDQITKQHKSGI
jgi:hypothetical protein